MVGSVVFAVIVVVAVVTQENFLSFAVAFFVGVVAGSVAFATPDYPCLWNVLFRHRYK